MESPEVSVLSIQSQVAVGHVGNGAALPALLARGIAPWAVPTAILAHHPGRRGGFRGRVTPAAEVATLVEGIRALPEFERCAGVLSGYQGDPGTPEVVAGAVDALRDHAPGAPYLCDPVLGDVGRGLYVHAALPEAVAGWLLPRASLVTPNPFELALLCGAEGPPTTVEAALAQARTLRDRGPERVVVTGLDLGEGAVGTLLVGSDAAHLSRQGKVEGVEAVKGTGDLLAALIMAELVLDDAGLTPAALDRATALVARLLDRAARLGLAELPLVPYPTSSPGL